MSKHISYPSIEQFRNVIQNVKRHHAYRGKDEAGEPIYDPLSIPPTLTFRGSVKIHGTNAGVCLHKGEFWAQSRENIITPEKDNAGFAFWAHNKKDELVQILEDIAGENGIDLDTYTLSLYGEWAGKGIQSGVAIAQLDKAFYLFGVKVSNPNDEAFVNYWIPVPIILDEENRIFTIREIKSYEIDIDFRYPELAQEKMIELVNEVEAECPIAKHFGVSGVGEGIVWEGNFNGNHYQFKTKGEKHSASKVKTLAPVDIEKVESIQKFIEYAVTPARFEQACQNIFGIGGEMDIKKMGDVIRWVVNDIIKEESDTLAENGLEPKNVNSKVSEAVRKLFFESFNKG